MSRRQAEAREERLAVLPRICGSILDTVGNTPVVRINKLAPEGVEVYVKLEAFNPLGSVKDRLALGIIEAAERDGTLKPGQTVIEATSGNTGIGLAMVCAHKGYPLVVTMAENFSVERRRLMRYLGARVILTPAAEKGSGMLNKARELADKHGWFLCRQFENEANADMHSRTTAMEILADFGENGLDYWVTGFGTGGTLKGVARVLKEKSPGTRIIATEPDNSPLLGSGVTQSYRDDGSPAASHPIFRPHLMQGWSPDFIPKLTNDVLEAQFIDRLVPISGADALEYARALARQEGIFCGITAGATFAAALQVAREAPKGSRILAMLPDTGERYLSTPLFDDITDTMSDEEMEISASTPSYRFDAPSQAAPAADGAAMPEPTEKARDFVEQVISDPDEPVVLFALEWCEFCWSVRKLFAAADVPFRSVDLDSVAYQENNWGGDIRVALRKKTGAPTIPQIFVGGEHVGGCTETLDAFKDGHLQDLLKAKGVSFDASKSVDPYEFFPKWLHPR
ncbi:cysteine synthase A [Nitratireductor sp. GCM10026969]|uniref:cysteine synthase A n=1 Tax=Nitratireductor sp. GCM10026969 TaxID=3252645 RepID=UPI003619DA81